ncbi:hypothetical protein MLD38_030734 [Melastoma candidum]|uniref:Uncharacterized protein n=1 Tax=Melastoma candidum TaxID=119954 RepID=A0ACB9MP32_9MYRT|nr:hypothetical protein MLD38_030734 [Melastoma candidum]
MDQISELPVDILHGIMSLLDTPEAIAMGVLSKRWKCVWDSFPVIYVSQRDLQLVNRGKYDEEIAAMWIDSMSRAFRRLRRERICQPRIEFDFIFMEPVLASALDEWMKMAVEGEVKELSLEVTNSRYVVPGAIFTCRSLVALELRGYGIDLSTVMGMVGNLPLRKLSLIWVLLYGTVLEHLLHCLPSIENLTILDPYGVRCLRIHNLDKLRVLHVSSSCEITEITAPSLRSLQLRHVHVDESFIAGLTKGCPLLEDLQLSFPEGLHRFDISGLPYLERVELASSDEKTTIHVNLPSLKRLRIFQRRHPLALQEALDISACRQLVELDIHTVSIRNSRILKDLISKFTALVNLSLWICDATEKVDISGPELRDIYLRGDNLKGIKIDAPRLHTFQFYGGVTLSLSVSSLVPMGVSLFLTDVSCLHSFSFSQTTKITMKLNMDSLMRSKVPEFVGIDVLPFRVDDLIIFMDKQSAPEVATSIVILLSICRPRNLLLNFSDTKWDRFIKVLYKKLVENRVPGVVIESLVLTEDFNGIRLLKIGSLQNLTSQLEALMDSWKNPMDCEALFSLNWSERPKRCTQSPDGSGLWSIFAEIFSSGLRSLKATLPFRRIWKRCYMLKD